MVTKKLPDQVRRRNTKRITHIPVSGRTGQVPKWPLPGKQIPSEIRHWKELWHSPQAVIWESQGWTRVVGRYVRIALEAEHRQAPAATRSEARQLEDRLLLNPLAMFRAQVQIVDDDGALTDGNITDLDAYREAVK